MKEGYLAMSTSIYPPNVFWNGTDINVKYAFQTVAPPDPEFGIQLLAGDRTDISGVFGFDVTAVWVWNSQNQQLPGLSLGSDPSTPTFLFELYEEGDGQYAYRTTPQKPINK